MATGRDVLRRLARPPSPPPPLTPARALRLATVRATERSLGVPFGVLGVADEEAPLDDLLGRLEEGLLALALEEEGGPVGFLALDAEARAAVVEAQTLGQPLDAPAEARESTSADAALARPLLEAFLAEAREATAGTALAGWIDAAALGPRLPEAREAALRLADGRYRAVRLTLDLGAGGRQGLLLALARVAPPAQIEEEAPPVTLAAQVLGARLPVEAVLHRLRLTLGEAEDLAPGQLLPLAGVTVASVRLEASGRDLGPARLGQVAGRRAIRVEVPLAPQLGALPTEGAGGIADPVPGYPAPVTAWPEPGSAPDPWSAQAAPAWDPAPDEPAFGMPPDAGFGLPPD